jgi:hypothetical protein
LTRSVDVYAPTHRIGGLKPYRCWLDEETVFRSGIREVPGDAKPQGAHLDGVGGREGMILGVNDMELRAAHHLVGQVEI